MLRAGVIGLGSMGCGIAVCLARAGRPLAVYDIDPDAAGRWPDGHLVPPVVASCAEVARNADVVVVVVVTAEQVRSVLFDADGLAVGAHPGLVVVVASTISMSDLADLQREAAEAGITLVDCGVTSPPREQHLKKVSAMVGADPEVYEHIRPVLEDFTQLTLLMGPPGAGMATKIARNLINYGGWRVAYEAALVAEAAGVDLGRMTELAARQEASGSPSLLWLRVKAGLFPSGGSTADQIRGLLCKDTRAVIELARAHGIELPVAQATLDSADDITAIWRSGEDGGDGQA